jgi:hypothetical protein
MSRLVSHLLIFTFCLVVLLAACGTGEQEATPEVEGTTFVTTPQAESGDTEFFETPTARADATYPSPVRPTIDPAYPVPDVGTETGRSLTALEAHEIALEVAQQQFAPDAELYVVIPSSVMLRNLGYPPVPPGWFFKYKRSPDELSEFIVQVVDDGISGSNRVAPIVPLEPLELPIDVSQVNLDSDDVFAQFEEVAEERGIPTEDVVYDLELVYLENSDEPVWSVVDPETLTWLYTISAVTGEEVEYTR